MSTMIALTNRYLMSKAAQNKPLNAKVAEGFGINTNISEKIISKVSSMQSEVIKLDNSINKNVYDQQSIAAVKDEAKDDQAIEAANAHLEAVQKLEESRLKQKMELLQKESLQELLAMIKTFRNQSYEGNSLSFKMLCHIATGKYDGTGVETFDSVDYSEAYLIANSYIEEIIKNAPENPTLLNMIITGQMLNGAQCKDIEDAPAKLLNKAAHSQSVMQMVKKLLNSGAIRLEDFAQKAIDMDPNSGITALLKLSDSTGDKSQKLSIINILSKVATESAGSNAGGLAARGLEKIIRKEGNQGLLDAAFHGLKVSAMAGNKQSLKSLENLAKDPTISMNKAIKAVKCLTAIAKSSSGASSEATDVLIGIANDKKVSTTIRKKTVEGLADVVKSGSGNAHKASETLLQLAKNPENPVGYHALENILTPGVSENMDQDKLSNVLFTAAKNQRLDKKMRIFSYNKLEDIYDRQGQGSSTAKGLIKNLARNTNDEIGKRAKAKVQQMKSFGNEAPVQANMFQANKNNNKLFASNNNMFSNTNSSLNNNQLLKPFMQSQFGFVK